jgi:Na+-transporting NADH:ubiquinone oxidoreductase subunit NqrC
MMPLPIQRTMALLLTICLVSLPMVQTAHAVIIPTDKAIELSDRTQQIERINEVLARETVQDVLVKLGVDPRDASARVASLTAAELQMLEGKLAELPAGGVGVVEVVGIVAIVLIVLELLNVSNFYTEF